ncbi:MAG: hypothetical protein P4L90_28400 [Rhodopila sp.]|nr:hypothetical protein [Rhodopila sp.]
MIRPLSSARFRHPPAGTGLSARARFHCPAGDDVSYRLACSVRAAIV